MSLRGLGFWPSTVAYACQFVVSALMRVRIEGLEHLPKSGAVIIAPNHLSNVDPPLVGGFMSPALDRRPRFLAKDALFVGPVGWFLRNQGVVPVKAGGSDMDAYRAAKSILADGDPMVIFP
jgi:1-acyl-sn-glycerol-3-phosphate acyltransferase